MNKESPPDPDPPATIASKVVAMKEEVAQVTKQHPGPQDPAPAWSFALAAGVGAAIIEQSAQLFFHQRLWHPYSLIPWRIIKANASLLLQTAPFVWPAAAAAIGYGIASLFGPKNSAGRRDITCTLAGFSWDRNSFCRGWLCTGATGSGKCWHPDTMVMLFDGTTKKVSDVRVGDRLMGDDSTPRTVLSTTKGNGPLFRISPEEGKGEPWICNDVHVMTLRSLGETVDVPLNEFLERTPEHRRDGCVWNLFRVGVDFDQDVNPQGRLYDANWFYLSGLWFGARWYVDNDPDEIGALRDFAEHNDLSPLLEVEVEESHAKVLPHWMLTAAREQRMALLAGLLDSTGRLSNSGYEITSKWKRVAEAIQFLARSLGLFASLDQYAGFECEGWRIGISGNLDAVPVQNVQNKAAVWLQKEDSLEFGWKAEPIGNGDYCGFTIDGNGRLLMADFTVTHNTQSGVNPVMHQVFMREAGEEKPTWAGSLLEAKLEELQAAYTAATEPVFAEIKKLEDEVEKLSAEREEVYQNAIAEQIDSELLAGLEGDAGSQVQQLKRELGGARAQRSAITQSSSQGEGAPQNVEAEQSEDSTLLHAELDARIALLESQIEQAEQAQSAPPKGAWAKKLADFDKQISERVSAIDRIEFDRIVPLRERLQNQLRKIEPARYKSYPWGGMCVDEKGLYYQTLRRMARHYRRDHHLMLLQTRPSWAPAQWRPPARFNLLSDEQIPVNTYAKAIVDTATSVAGGEGDKGFFRTQAESNIGWAIELQRGVKRCRIALGDDPKLIPFPSIKLTLELLSNKDVYSAWLEEQGCRPLPSKKNKDRPSDKPEVPRLDSPQLTVALDHFAARYWSQPPDQLGGVQGTIYNYLNYFTNDDVAEVFCADNTFEFRDIDLGMILCVAMPQKLQVERRYVCTLLKLLFYQHVLRRFDLGDKAPAWVNRNLLICWQDEAQRFVTESDGNVDVIREAGATTFMACQGKPSLYAPLGGKEKASVTLLNLRNRIIFEAADDDCANGSAEFLGKTERTKKSRSTSSSGTSYSYSMEDVFRIKPHQFRALPKFTAVVCHADSKHRRAVICPITPDGKLRVEWLPSAQRFSYRIQDWLGRGWKAVQPKNKRQNPNPTPPSNVK